MNNSNLWSLRLGFSGKQATAIENLGLTTFLEKSFASAFVNKLPLFLQDDPKTLSELKEFRTSIKELNDEEKKKLLKKQLRNSVELKKWWIETMVSEEFPLREKMTLFWHNHFVSTSQKVKVNYWIYQHNMILREHAFGNFKELTKKIVKSNAMLRYLDNVDNKNEKINENLSRELLELFTLGIGNYTEDDIKNGALALAGLGLGEEKGQYRKIFENNSTKNYLGKSGNFKADDLIDIIFEQKNIPYLITRKILKWFIYDNPSEDLVLYYGDYFKKMNFEIQPLLTKIITEEYIKNNEGSKIKDPLVYLFQLIDELNITEIKPQVIQYFLKQQGMDLFNQPNVKGWDGGNSWLSSQLYLQRNTIADLLCKGQIISRNEEKTVDENAMITDSKSINLQKISVNIKFDTLGNNKKIIKQLSDRLLYNVSETIQTDMENILKYDFNPKDENANFAVIRLFNYISKLPEFQLI